MSDIAILKEMIKPQATALLEDHYNRTKVKLIEPQNYSITIYGMPNDDEVIIIKTDRFDSPNNFFEGQKGECRRADFVIIANTETKRIILCIEMKAKSTTSTELKIIQQLKGVKCLISYCREIGQSFWNQQDFLNDYEYRFVSIRNISIPKKPTRISHKTGIHNCPEQMLKVNSPHNLQFRSLI